MSNENEGRGHNSALKKRKRRWDGGDGARKSDGKQRKKMKEDVGRKVVGEVINVDQLAWNKISLENDEFEDFEEIEGVDVEYVEKGGKQIIQFKVHHF
jgi:hypothetical protein